MPRHRRNANQRYHDRVAGRYEEIYDDGYWQWHDSLTWDYLKRHLPTDLRAPTLDLGCGSGKWGRRLLKSGYHVTFVDLSAKMVDEAAAQVEAAGGGDRASFLQADILDLSALPADHFGLILAMGEPIGCTSNPGQALRQIARRLRPAGMLIATFDNRVACLDYYLNENDPQAMERFLRTGQTRWLTRDPSEQFELHAFTPDELRKLCAAAGLEVVEMIGKTVLPMRRHRELLEDPGARRRWADIEKQLSREPSNLGACAHIQVAARLQAG